MAALFHSQGLDAIPDAIATAEAGCSTLAGYIVVATQLWWHIGLSIAACLGLTCHALALPLYALLSLAVTLGGAYLGVLIMVSSIARRRIRIYYLVPGSIKQLHISISDWIESPRLLFVVIT